MLGVGSSVSGPGGVIAELTQISLAGIQRDVIDVTSHQSASMAKEFIPGVVDGVTVDLIANFLPSNSSQSALKTNLQQPVASGPITSSYVITWANGTTWQFQGFVTKVEPMSKYNDKMTANVTIKITGSLITA